MIEAAKVKPVKTLIAGASGFVGQNLLPYLLDMGAEVTPLSLRGKWEEQVNHCDVIINLVGKAHDHTGTEQEEAYYFANVELTKQIFHVFAKSKAKLLIHISSLAALEEFESSRPLNESDECHPVSWYGNTKREAEEWLMAQKVPDNKKLIILRPPMIHGPGDKGNLTRLYKLISKGAPYPLASFDNKRSFISIQNFCFYIKQIIDNQDKLVSDIYHIADNEPVSTKQVIEIMKRESGNKVINLPIPKFLVKGIARVGDVMPILPLNTKKLKKMTSDLLVSNAKINQVLELNQLPVTALEGLQMTIQSFKNM